MKTSEYIKGATNMATDRWTTEIGRRIGPSFELLGDAVTFVRTTRGAKLFDNLTAKYQYIDSQGVPWPLAE